MFTRRMDALDCIVEQSAVERAVGVHSVRIACLSHITLAPARPFLIHSAEGGFSVQD